MPFIDCVCGHASNRHGRGKKCRADDCDCEQFQRATPVPERAPRDAAWYREYHHQRRGDRQPWDEYVESRHVHPSLNCYTKHHCRCEGCKAWNRVACRNEREIGPWRSAPSLESR